MPTEAAVRARYSGFMVEEATFRIRRASDGDANAIAALLREAFATYERLYTAAAYAATTPDAPGVRSRMSEGPVWIGLRGRLVLGTAAAMSRDDGLYVRGMAVAPRARGLGLGGLLLREIEAYARARRHARLLLSTTPFLDAAIRLYERAGFQRIDEGPHDLHGTPLFTMHKPLALDERGR